MVVNATVSDVACVDYWFTYGGYVDEFVLPQRLLQRMLTPSGDRMVQILIENLRKELGPLYKLAEGVAVLDMVTSFCQLATVQDYGETLCSHWPRILLDDLWWSETRIHYNTSHQIWAASYSREAAQDFVYPQRCLRKLWVSVSNYHRLVSNSSMLLM